MWRILRDGLIAVLVDATVRFLLPSLSPILPFAWTAILIWLTSDLLKSKIFKSQVDQWALHLSAWHPMVMYFVLFVIGGMVLCFYWWGVNSALSAASKLGVRKDNSTVYSPISVTGFSIDAKPYVAGKVLHFNLRLNSIISDLKVKGGFKIWTGTADDAALKLENRQLTEDRLWKEFEATPPIQKIPISWTRGEMISVCDGPVLTQEQADRLNGENGIVYIMGQIDYGDGALDFGGYVRTANPQVGILSVEHNGSAERRFFQNTTPQPVTTPTPFREREDVIALRELKDYYFRGVKMSAEIVGFPGIKVTNSDWDDIERWWRGAIKLLNQPVFSSFLTAGDLQSLDALEDDESFGATECIRTLGPAGEQRLGQCWGKRLKRVSDLTAKIEGREVQPVITVADLAQIVEKCLEENLKWNYQKGDLSAKEHFRYVTKMPQGLPVSITLTRSNPSYLVIETRVPLDDINEKKRKLSSNGSAFFQAEFQSELLKQHFNPRFDFPDLRWVELSNRVRYDELTEESFLKCVSDTEDQATMVITQALASLVHAEPIK